MLRQLPMDPITATPIPASRHFKLRTGPQCHTYDVISLAKTIMASTGPPCDPITQLPLSKCDLQRIDTTVQCAGAQLPSVEALWARQISSGAMSPAQCLLELMDMRLAETVDEVITALECMGYSDDAYYQLYFTVIIVALPNIIKYLEDMAQFDEEYAKHIADTVLQRLHGPPNRPTCDPTKRILSLAIRTLRQQLSMLA